MKITRYKLFILLFYSGYFATDQQVKVIKYPALDKLINQTKDSVLVVNFWATWCKPCVEELPHFEKVSAQYKNKSVKVVLINLDAVADLNKKVKPFVAKNKLRATTIYLLDEPDYNSWIDKVSTDWSGSLPFTLIVSPENKSRKSFEQPLTQNQLETALKAFVQ
ncbi:TlpA disulfide reductase family protein [Emticicia sp. TH156]|uniref:TlpA disulfide reductase family protein n=1 Tax=Emticicia sp. TH156 TaxID=2067454 RepID=UPI000C7829D8|nr:TlpA disulfide reductase family protein [Emticicia sp. TH156]PLK46071.1 TlpA family protein disulfide reductase [Emticicia sp. TH156]